MIEFTIGISILVGVLFFVLLASYVFNWKKGRILISSVVFVLALISMILFYYMQKVNGNPDQGIEFWQWYLPLSIYFLLCVLSILSFTTTIKKGKFRK